MALWLLYAAIAVVTFLIFKRRRNEGKNLNEPPVVPYLIPFIGSMVTFGMNPMKFLQENREKVCTRTHSSIHQLTQIVWRDLYVLDVWTQNDLLV